jgi:hypothetical protein
VTVVERLLNLFFWRNIFVTNNHSDFKKIEKSCEHVLDLQFQNLGSVFSILEIVDFSVEKR